MLGMQEYLRFNVLLLNIFRNLCSGGKCLLIRQKKCFPMFVFTVLLYCGLNHVMLLLCFFSSFWLCTFFFTYSGFSLNLQLARLSFDENKEENLVAIDFGVHFKIDGG